MKLHKLGENGLVRRLQSRFNVNLPSDVLSGIGDDCAVIHRSETEVELITCDMLIEDVHFRLEQTSPEALGHKALAVNLSDIAGMGGIPEAAFLSLAIPKTADVDWLDGFFDGVQKLARAHDTHVLGGDLTHSPMVVVNFTIIGKANPENIRYRHQATPGDILCTTGFLGNAGAGLRVLCDQAASKELSAEIYLPLTESLLKPDPHLQKGQWLAQQPAVHAMMDISDGIAADLPRLTAASEVGALVNLEQLPISSQLKAAAKIMKWNAYDLATTAGEDYCLLLTVDRNAFSTLDTQYQACFGEPLFKIGLITKEPRSIVSLDHGVATNLSKGFDHFLNPS